MQNLDPMLPDEHSTDSMTCLELAACGDPTLVAVRRQTPELWAVNVHALPVLGTCPAGWDRAFPVRGMFQKRETYIDSKMLSDSSAMLPQHSKRKAFLQKDPGFVFVF